MNWKDAITELVDEGLHRTQGEMLAELLDRGFAVNQGSLSRELKSRGIAKVNGVYQPPGRFWLGAPIHAFNCTAGGGMGVVKTEPAFAPIVAKAIDHADLEGVLGTIAGDDTVFVALDGEAGRLALESLLDEARRDD